MGALFSDLYVTLKGLDKTVAYISFVIFLVSFIYLATVTYSVSGTPFISTIPPNTSFGVAVADMLLLATAWAICVPLCIVSLIVGILLLAISKII
uniref:Uncharacterized protein n=1 Tax=viral metagenome TaxID=1070528 RepID=A0A6C0JXV0_9ZZZZ